MRRSTCFAALTMAILAIGCASSGSQSGQPQPDLQLVQLSNVADAARHMTGGIAVQYRLTIHNTTTAPLRLKRIDLQSVGTGAYSLPSLTQSYDRMIDAGATDEIDLRGAAFIQDSTIVGANGPVTIRVVAQFESPTGYFQRVVVQQVHSAGGV